MDNYDDELKKAKIRFGTSVRVERDNVETIVRLYSVNTDNDRFFFECRFVFAENGYDFYVTIVNFGLHRVASAGSTGSDFRKKFSQEQIKIAKDLIDEYFLGESGKNDFPQNHHNSQCLGINYPPNWILKAPN